MAHSTVNTEVLPLILCFALSPSPSILALLLEKDFPPPLALDVGVVLVLAQHGLVSAAGEVGSGLRVSFL